MRNLSHAVYGKHMKCVQESKEKLRKGRNLKKTIQENKKK